MEKEISYWHTVCLNQDDRQLQQARPMSQKLGKYLKVMTYIGFAILSKLLAYHYREYISFESAF